MTGVHVVTPKCKVLGVGGRPFRPANNRALSRSTSGTHFQVVSKQQGNKLWLACMLANWHKLARFVGFLNTSCQLVSIRVQLNICWYVWWVMMNWVDVSSNIDFTWCIIHFWQLTVAVCLIQPMAVLIILLEQQWDRQPPTVVTQATTWWETVLTLVKLQEIGLGIHLPVKVCIFIS